MVTIQELNEWGSVLTMVATVIWAVSKIKTTTERLSMSLEHLREIVVKLDGGLSSMTAEVGMIRDRVTRIETRIEVLSACARLSPAPDPHKQYD